MITIDIKLNRFATIAKRFPDVVEKHIEDASRLGVAEAKSRSRVRTGRMRGSIRTIDNGFAVHVPYAQFNEFGTRRMSAKPFMRPAANLAKRAVVARLERMEKDLV